MNKKRLFKVVAAMLCLALLGLLAGCGESQDALAKIKAKGKLVVGTSADYAPYEFHTIINGKDTIVGFDIELMKQIANDMGVELVIQDMQFDGLLPALNTGKVDAVVAGMSPNEERRQAVDFTEIYYQAAQGVLVRAEDKDKYRSIADLKGKNVCAQLGTIQEKIVKEQMKDSTLVSLGKIPDMVLELKNHKVDALVLELPVANGYVTNNKDLVISQVTVEDPTGGSAIAVKKGEKSLVDAMNVTIEKLKKNGTIDKFVAEANEMNVTK